MLTDEKKEFLKRVEEYAKREGTEFVWVYRGEGEHYAKQESLLNRHLKGTWYTEYFDKALGFKEQAIEKGNLNAKVLAVITTRQLLESRDSMAKGMGEINILTENIQPREVDREIEEAPTKDDYLNQFKGYSEYREEKEINSESIIS